MYVYEKYDYSLFESRFKDYSRLDNFPRGLRELYTFLEDLAEDTGESIEVDVIALCCEFTECTIKEALEYYGLETIEELQDNTLVIMVDDDEEDLGSTIIYQNY